MNVNGRRAAIVAGVAVVAITLVVLAYTGTIAALVFNRQDSSTNVSSAAITESISRPRLVLTILKGNEDSSVGIGSYEENSTNPIVLAEGQHIRFESPDYRRSDGMKVTAMGPDGNIHILLKSYDVNNEYFINVDRGTYEIRVQARWVDNTYFYSFNVQVT